LSLLINIREKSAKRTSLVDERLDGVGAKPGAVERENERSDVKK
jgi:hypothetical protein